MTAVVRILGLVVGGPTAFDGKFLKEYDPGRQGFDPDGRPMTAHVVVTDDIEEAMKFESMTEFHMLYRAVDPDNPMRPDGRPNRPLTAFTVEVTKIEET